MIEEEGGWMKIKSSKMDYYLELSNDLDAGVPILLGTWGVPTVRSK